jgi:hypothetical protein
MNNSPTESLLAHQWSGYLAFHRSRANLLLHIIAVPAFLLANVALILVLLLGAWIPAGVTAAVMALALIAQRRGHRLEPTPPEPFTGPVNAMLRILAEQWVTFPRYVLSGQWLRAFRQREAP